MTEQATATETGYTQAEIQHLKPLWIGYDEIFTLTGIGRFKINHLINANRFPKPIKLGKKVVRWSVADVMKWINKMEQVRGFDDEN